MFQRYQVVYGPPADRPQSQKATLLEDAIVQVAELKGDATKEVERCAGEALHAKIIAYNVQNALREAKRAHQIAVAELAKTEADVQRAPAEIIGEPRGENIFCNLSAKALPQAVNQLLSAAVTPGADPMDEETRALLTRQLQRLGESPPEEAARRRAGCRDGRPCC